MDVVGPVCVALGGAGMSGYYDREDTRSQRSREATLFRNLRTLIAVAKPRAAALRRRLRDFGLAGIENREALEKLPVLRRAEMEKLRADDPPYGGFVATRAGLLKRVCADAPQGQARDWWGCARPLAAAGAKPGDTILNCHSYHLAMSGFMVEDGAAEIGCAIIPAGNARVERKLREIHLLRPSIYCGDAEQLKQILDQARLANCDVSSLRSALVFDRNLTPRLRAEIESSGVRVHKAYVTSDHGVVAYEVDLPDGRRNEGMIVNEGVILEIVRPGTNERLADGEIGEVVVTRVNPDYPLLRYSTGDLSRIIPGPSPCGRTAPRIAGWLGRVEEIVRIGDRDITPACVLELLTRQERQLRLQVRVEARDGEDCILVVVESPDADAGLAAKIAGDMREIVDVWVEVEFVVAGTLADNSPLVVDMRGRRGG